MNTRMFSTSPTLWITACHVDNASNKSRTHNTLNSRTENNFPENLGENNSLICTFCITWITSSDYKAAVPKHWLPLCAFGSFCLSTSASMATRRTRQSLAKLSAVANGALVGAKFHKKRFLAVQKDWRALTHKLLQAIIGHSTPLCGCFQKLGYPKMDGL